MIPKISGSAVPPFTLPMFHRSANPLSFEFLNRYVRLVLLCGTDVMTGNCFDHGKEWIQRRQEFLAGPIFFFRKNCQSRDLARSIEGRTAFLRLDDNANAVC